MGKQRQLESLHPRKTIKIHPRRTLEECKEAALKAFKLTGKRPTYDAVRDIAGGGSDRVILKAINEVESKLPPKPFCFLSTLSTAFKCLAKQPENERALELEQLLEQEIAARMQMLAINNTTISHLKQKLAEKEQLINEIESSVFLDNRG